MIDPCAEFDRMKKLLEGVGLLFNENGITNAEIYAYAYGIAFVRERLGRVLSLLFINLSENTDLSKYTQLLNLDFDNTDTETLKSYIFERLGESFGDYTQTSFNKAFKMVGSGKYEISDDKIVFKNVNGQDLYKLAKFIEAYVFAFTNVNFDGEGLSFDMWDLWGQQFFSYDRMNLPFSIIDSLRSDIIEQYE